MQGDLQPDFPSGLSDSAIGAGSQPDMHRSGLAAPPPSSEVFETEENAGGSLAGGSLAGISLKDPALGYDDDPNDPDRQILADENGRQRFDTFELAMVLSEFDIGPIQKIKPFPRGSRKAPKLLIRSNQGLFILKRRAKGKDDDHKITFCHGIQTHLTAKGFPLPHLVPTRSEQKSVLQLPSGAYELFEFIRGTGYDTQSLSATAEAGRVLSLFHKLLADYQPTVKPPRGSYHRSNSVLRSLEQIPETLSQVDPDACTKRVKAVCDSLTRNYKRAAKTTTQQNLDNWPKQVAHSDWHPGNLLFQGNKIVAVIDYDAARLLPRILDVANGALQFSIQGSGGQNVDDWPSAPDRARLKRFIRGYNAVPNHSLTQEEIALIPLLMIEALIAEAAIPIAAQGMFATISGLSFLKMVQRKVRWLREHQKQITTSLAD